MRDLLPKHLIHLAAACPFPLYVVGGTVRDFLSGFPCRGDWDICAPGSEEALTEAAKACGFLVRAVYRRTGTVKLEDPSGAAYEFTRFRSDRYVRGEHTPAEIFFTENIADDARRRDFTANAVYYDIRGDALLDPLGGIPDIHAKILRTVAPAEKVFGEDGLRLMRLARIAAQTGFSPDKNCLLGAKKNAALIEDIVPERVFAELSLLLCADALHGDAAAPYRGLCILKETGVLAHILPELWEGNGMPQRADFHKYDVLEHSLRCVLYAEREVRLAALLHDVGKPFCQKRDGNFYAHAEEGTRIAEEILLRLKAPKQVVAETKELVLLHMRDYNLAMREGKLRRELLKNYALLPKLLALKQADFSACRDDLSPAPCVEKWQHVLLCMREEGVPFTLKELAVNGRDLQKAGIPPAQTGKALEELLLFCAEDGKRNTHDRLLRHVEKKFAHTMSAKDE